MYKNNLHIYIYINFFIILCTYPHIRVIATINQKDFVHRPTYAATPSGSLCPLWTGDETRGFSTNENKIPSLLPYGLTRGALA